MSMLAYTAAQGLSLSGSEAGAWLADETAESVVSSDLITNGDFATDTVWTKETGWSIAAGVASCDGSQITTSAIYQSTSAVTGKTYVIVYTVSNYSAGTVTPYVGSKAGNAVSANGTYFDTIISSGANVFLIGSSDFVGDIDNVSLRIASPDHSANNNAIQVFGTLTKAAVNTGCELMAWSGFSASNYIEQPYNSDLDYGTGSFFFSYWQKQPAISVAKYGFMRGYYSGGWVGSAIDSYIDANGRYNLRQTDDAFSTTDSVLTTKTYDDNEWHHIICIKDSTVGANGTIYLYVDGELQASTAITAATGSMNNSNATLRVGVNQNGSSPNTDGSIALVKTGAFAPTAAQAKQGYDAEKILFEPYEIYTQVGAQYSIDLAPQVLQRRKRTIRNQQKSLDGSPETLVHRHEPLWDVVTHPIHKNSLSSIRRALDSMADGHTFTFDPHGSVASAYLPRNAVLENADYTEQKIQDSPLYHQIAFQVREL